MILIPPEINYFNLFNLKIYYYSLCIFTAILISLFISMYISDKYIKNANKDVILDLTPGLVISAIIGARIYYVILSIEYYIKNPLSIFMIWQGGIAIHGAFIFGAIYGFLYLRKKKLKFLPYADAVCSAFPLGQAIGRWGNFFNSEAFGIPTTKDALFSLYVQKNMRPHAYSDNELFCPTFLWESIFDVLIFLILFFLIKKNIFKREGLVFFSYILLYSILRLIIEFFRLDTVFYLWKIPFPALVSCAGILIGISGILFLKKKYQE